MKARLGLFAAFALVGLPMPTYAQAPPPGSYQRTCRDFRMQGTTLSAVCAREHGRGEQLTALNVAHCHGDIRNLDGQLQCTGGQPMPPPRQEAAPLYPGPGYPPPAGYPPPGYGRDERWREEQAFREHCERLESAEHESATGSATRPTARNARGWNIAWEKSTRSASGAGAAKRFPASGPGRWDRASQRVLTGPAIRAGPKLT